MPDIAAAATNPEAVRLLWEVCQIPDFRKIMSDTPCAFARVDLSPSAPGRSGGCRWISSPGR